MCMELLAKLAVQGLHSIQANVPNVPLGTTAGAACQQCRSAITTWRRRTTVSPLCLASNCIKLYHICMIQISCDMHKMKGLACAFIATHISALPGSARNFVKKLTFNSKALVAPVLAQLMHTKTWGCKQLARCTAKFQYSTTLYLALLQKDRSQCFSEAKRNYRHGHTLPQPHYVPEL